MPPANNLSNHMQRQLRPATLRYLRAAGEIAARDGYRLFLVGGTVRDLILERPAMDPDLLVEEPHDAPVAPAHHHDPSMAAAATLAETLARELGGDITARSQFGTVKLTTPEMPLDLATARIESYHRPGALPTVRPGAVEDDLARRDFSVNAMAADLAPGRFAEVLDLHGGLDDLRARRLRPLHDGSFVDDATRILRALRYEARLGLRMTPECEAMARRDASFLGVVSGDRVRNDLERMFQEASPEGPLQRGEALDVLRAILPALSWRPKMSEAARSLREADQRVDPLTYLALLAAPLALDDADTLARRLASPGHWGTTIRDAQRVKELLPLLSDPATATSAIYAALSDLAPVAALAWSALAEDAVARERLAAFPTTMLRAATSLRGTDLLALGVPSGPDIGRLLQELRDARLDGILESLQDEEGLVRRRVAEQSPPPNASPGHDQGPP